MFRKLVFTAFLILMANVGAYSQTLGDVLERVRAVKFFEMDRIDVKQVLYEMTFDDSVVNIDYFTYGAFDIEAYYSSTECAEDEGEFFQAEKGKVIRIVISSTEIRKVDHLGFDLSELKKEQMYRDNDARFIYHDKKLGLAVDVDDDEVEEVILFPPVNSKTKACDFDTAKDFVKKESWFGSKKLQDRTGEIVCYVANVNDLSLSANELTALSSKRLEVVTSASDPENDVLTYVYVVSGGRIIGTGDRVVWDLSGTAPGRYSITAGVDDGCGLCGATVTKTVVIK